MCCVVLCCVQEPLRVTLFVWVKMQKGYVTALGFFKDTSSLKLNVIPSSSGMFVACHITNDEAPFVPEKQ